MQNQKKKVGTHQIQKSGRMQNQHNKIIKNKCSQGSKRSVQLKLKGLAEKIEDYILKK